jgi:hypothetical protein
MYFTNKTDRDDIPKLLFKMALNTINQIKSNQYLTDIFGILLEPLSHTIASSTARNERGSNSQR